MVIPGIVVIALGVFAIINIIFYLFFLKLGNLKTKELDSSISIPVSIIVCSKNESQNLKKLVPLLLEQDYSNFEIILINDASIDDTLDVIDDFCDQDTRVKKVNVVNNESFWANKKYALTLGIKKASHSHLLFIDADCEPASPQWISHMAGNFQNKDIVLGYGGYQKQKNSLLNALIRYETGITAIQYLSYAAHGNPYMGVGRNLGYTSTLFYEVSGFMSHMNVLGGDDDLFVNQAATKNNTALSFHPDSFTISEPKQSWKSWWNQKKRHINTAQHYKGKHKFTLGLYFISQLCFFIAAVLAFVFGYWPYALGIVLLRYLVMWIAVGRGLSRFRESDIIIITPFLEIILVITQVFLFVSNKINPPKQWS